MSPINETLQIETPENVAFGYEVAGIGSRFMATLVDTALIFMFEVLLVILAVGLLVAVERLDSSLASELNPWIIGGVGLALFVAYWGYYIFFETIWNGQSPGKRWGGLRVIRTDGLPATLAEAVIRNLVRMVDFLPSFYGLGVVVMFIDRRSRRLGDMAAGTLVVFDRPAVTLASLAAQPRPAAAPLGAPAWPVEKLLPADLQLAEDYLNRAGQLVTHRSLAQQVLNKLLARMELPLPPGDVPAADQFIAEILRAARARQK